MPRQLIKHGLCAFSATLWLSACLDLPEPPPEALIKCTSDNDCPASFFCKKTLQRCINAAQKDESPPTLVGDANLYPPRVGVAGIVHLGLEVNENLGVAPKVSVSGSARYMDALPGQGGRSLSWIYEVSAEDTEGEHSVKISLIDSVGNSASYSVGSFVIDRTPPDHLALEWILAEGQLGVQPDETVAVRGTISMGASIVDAQLVDSAGGEFGAVAGLLVSPGISGGETDLVSGVINLQPYNLQNGQQLRLRVSIADDLGNIWQAPLSPSLTIDASGPSAMSISLEPSPITATTEIEVLARATDAQELFIDGDLIDSAQVRNWIDMASLVTVHLTEMPGDKSVTARFRDDAGNESDTLSAQVRLLTGPVLSLPVLNAPPGQLAIKNGDILTVSGEGEVGASVVFARLVTLNLPEGQNTTMIVADGVIGIDNQGQLSGFFAAHDLIDGSGVQLEVILAARGTQSNPRLSRSLPQIVDMTPPPPVVATSLRVVERGPEIDGPQYAARENNRFEVTGLDGAATGAIRVNFTDSAGQTVASLPVSRAGSFATVHLPYISDTSFHVYALDGTGNRSVMGTPIAFMEPCTGRTRLADSTYIGCDLFLYGLGGETHLLHATDGNNARIAVQAPSQAAFNPDMARIVVLTGTGERFDGVYSQEVYGTYYWYLREPSCLPSPIRQCYLDLESHFLEGVDAFSVRLNLDDYRGIYAQNSSGTTAFSATFDDSPPLLQFGKIWVRNAPRGQQDHIVIPRNGIDDISLLDGDLSSGITVAAYEPRVLDRRYENWGTFLKDWTVKVGGPRRLSDQLQVYEMPIGDNAWHHIKLYAADGTSVESQDPRLLQPLDLFVDTSGPRLANIQVSPRSAGNGDHVHILVKLVDDSADLADMPVLTIGGREATLVTGDLNTASGAFAHLEYGFDVDTSIDQPGRQEILLRASDVYDNPSVLRSVLFIDTQPPMTTILIPAASGTTFNGLPGIAGRASDGHGKGIKAVEFSLHDLDRDLYFDGASFGNGPQSWHTCQGLDPWSAALPGLTDGTSYELQVRARDLLDQVEASPAIAHFIAASATPAAPTNVQVTAHVDGTLSVSWGENSTVSAYHLYFGDPTAGTMIPVGTFSNLGRSPVRLAGEQATATLQHLRLDSVLIGLTSVDAQGLESALVVAPPVDVRAWRVAGSQVVPATKLNHLVVAEQGEVWAAGEHGVLLRSQDEGVSFEVVPTGSASDVLRLTIEDDRIYVATADVVLGDIDGSGHPTPIFTSPDASPIVDVAVIGDKVAVATGMPNSSIFISLDRGRTFATAKRFYSSPYYPSYQEIYSLYEMQRGTVVVNSGPNQSYASEDMSAWRGSIGTYGRGALIADRGGWIAFCASSRANANINNYVVTPPGQRYSSRVPCGAAAKHVLVDLGAHFLFIGSAFSFFNPSPGAADVPTVNITGPRDGTTYWSVAQSAGVIVATGSNSAIARAVGAEASFHEVDYQRGLPTLRKVVATGSNFVATGDQGTVLQSVDQGMSWWPTPSAIPSRPPLNSAWISNGTIVAAGDFGRLICSRDSGLSMTEIDTNSPAPLTHVWGLGDDWWVTGDPQGLWTSHDDCQTWSLQQPIASLIHGDAITQVAAASGVIWHHTNGVSGFVISQGDAVTEPLAIAGGGQTWLVGGRAQDLVVSDDGGTHFSRVNLPVPGDVESLWVLGQDATVVLANVPERDAGSSETAVLISQDGGHTFAASSCGELGKVHAAVGGTMRRLVLGSAASCVSWDSGQSWQMVGAGNRALLMTGGIVFTRASQILYLNNSQTELRPATNYELHGATRDIIAVGASSGSKWLMITSGGQILRTSPADSW